MVSGMKKIVEAIITQTLINKLYRRNLTVQHVNKIIGRNKLYQDGLSGDKKD
jgi:hypothetical protein